MNLIRTSILSGISTFIRFITGFISVKIVAIYIGPSGMALLGQFQNFVSMISTIASAGISAGVVKYTAEYIDEDEEKHKYWSASTRIAFVLFVPLIFILTFFSEDLSIRLFNTNQYYKIFWIFAVSLMFYILNTFMTSILNGQREIKTLTLVNISGGIFGFLMTIFLVLKFKLYGALIAGIITQSIIFIITLFFIIRTKWFKIRFFFRKIEKKHFIRLLKYSLMTLISGIITPWAFIFLRKYMIDHFGSEQAGLWQGIWRISETYLGMITTTLSIYYLPKLSGILDKKELKKEILYGYKIIMPVVIIVTVILYFLRYEIINLLFTEKFLPMEKLFFYQFLGNILKIASWLLSFLMIAKAMTRLFIFTEIFFLSTFVIFGIIFMNYYGIIGMTMGYLTNYTIYFLFLIYKFSKYLNN